MKLRKIVVSIWLILSALPAYALDFTVVLKNADGSPAEDCAHVTVEGRCDRITAMTLGRLSAAGISKGNANAPLPEQVLNGRLASRIVDSKDAVLSADEIVKIKDGIGKLGYNTVIVAEAISILDPDSVKDK